jgi:hypothetical protein
MKGYVHLQGMGDFAGTPVSKLRVGDKVIFNYGIPQWVAGIEPTRGGSYRIMWRSSDGKFYPQIKRGSTLVALA